MPRFDADGKKRGNDETRGSCTRGDQTLFPRLLPLGWMVRTCPILRKREKITISMIARNRDTSSCGRSHRHWGNSSQVLRYSYLIDPTEMTAIHFTSIYGEHGGHTSRENFITNIGNVGKTTSIKISRIQQKKECGRFDRGTTIFHKSSSEDPQSESSLSKIISISTSSTSSTTACPALPSAARS